MQSKLSITAVSLALVLTLVFNTVSAQSISGRIFDYEANPLLEPILVQCSTDLDSWIENTVNNGFYEFRDLQPGDYYVRAMSAGEGWYCRSYWPGGWSDDDAEILTIRNDENWEDMDFYLQMGGKIQGAIIPADGGHFPERSISLVVFDPSDVLFFIHPFWSDQPINPEDYTTIPLPPNEYVAAALPAPPDMHIRTLYGNTFSYEDAVPFMVNSGETTGDIDFEIPLGGGVTGVISAEGVPLPFSAAFCFVNDRSFLWSSFPCTYGFSNAQGIYTVYGIPEGNCYLMFQPHGNLYLTEYWRNAYDILHATPIRVNAGSITENINSDLNLGGRISGTLRDPNGEIPQTVEWDMLELVSAVEMTDDVTIVVDQEGNWETDDPVAPGIYTIRMNPISDNRFWRITHLGDSFFPWDAQWFRLILSEDKEPLQIQYQLGGAFNITLLDPQGNPVPTANFNLWLDGRELKNYTVESSEEGQFQINGLSTGEYIIAASIDPEDYMPEPEMRDQPPDPDHLWPLLYSGNATSFRAAQTVRIETGQVTAVEMRFINGGVVHITVFNPNHSGLNLMTDDVTVAGLPVRDDGVVFYDAPSTTQDGPFVSDEGTFTILAPGTYTILAAPIYTDLHPDVDPPSLTRTFLGDVADYDDAASFTIQTGQTVEAEINMIAGGHSISGRLLSEVGLTPSSGTVLLIRRTMRPVAAYFAYLNLNIHGTYTIKGIPDGDYFALAMLNDQEGFLMNTWRPDVAAPGVQFGNLLSIPQEAQGIHVAGADLNNINITMQRAADYRSVPLDNPVKLPDEFMLCQPYPNPFNEMTIVPFMLVNAGRVKAQLYDLQGRLVQQVVDHNFGAGANIVSLDASGLAAGTYLLRMSTGDVTRTRKVVLLR